MAKIMTTNNNPKLSTDDIVSGIIKDSELPMYAAKGTGQANRIRLALWRACEEGKKSERLACLEELEKLRKELIAERAPNEAATIETAIDRLKEMK